MHAAITGQSSSNTFQYTDRENDGTGLYYYRARYYGPTFQRFISEDPLGFGGGDANFYAYVFNSPTNFIDPSGMVAPGIGIHPHPTRTSGRKDRHYHSCFGGDAICDDSGRVVGQVGAQHAMSGDFLIAGAVGAAQSAVAGLLDSLAESEGTTLAEAIEQGLVNPSGKLAQILDGIESGFTEAPPGNQLEALDIIKQAVTATGNEMGKIISIGEDGAIVLQNVGGLITTVGSEGSILVQRGADIVLHLIP